MEEFHDDDIEQIAIIGMAGRFPGATNVDQFWQNLREGKECTTQFSEEDLLERGVTKEEFSHPDYVKSGLVLENIDLFDAGFFGYTAKQAEMMDPQQRIFLEIAWEALENSGCNPDTYEGAIGVFGGAGGNDYRKQIAADFSSVTSDIEPFQVMIANDPDFLTTRVAYSLNLKGPCFTLQTACSTSLVAVHVACQHLLMYQCDVALAGGVSIRLPQGVGYRYREGMIWSPDGHCRAFAADAGGTLLGRGAGIVVLKRLSEAIAERDTIYAVIKGSAINNDGALKVGFTAPSVDGQAAVISMAQGISGVSPETISYVEAHGTGTPLGDPIEIQALTQAFRLKTAAKNFCAIGSVKTNVGHLDQAAGVAGLIKTVLSLKNKEIPPSLHCKKPNPNIDFPNSPFYVNTELTDWQSDNGPRRAGVSSFGIGGTNAHLVLEEAPLESLASTSKSRSYQLLLLSAKSQSALQRFTANLSECFRTTPHIILADAAYTLQTGRKHFDFRSIAVCENISQAVTDLSVAGNYISNSVASATSSEGIVFMFSGQGSQYINMCRGLYEEEPFFKKQIDSCTEILSEHLNCDLRDILFPPSENDQVKQLINQTYITQPALFVVEYSLAKLLMKWGITPKAMVGHSIGEYVCACLAGVFSLNDALLLVAARGRMMQALESGTMLAVPLSEEEVVPLLPEELSIAVINSPQMTVVSGNTLVIEAFKEKIIEENDIECRTLYTSHAFHSSMMDPIVEQFTDLVSSINRNNPAIPFVSNVSGTWISNEQATSAEYWANHLRRAVRFYSCLTTLMENDFQIFLEVGPGQVLTQIARQHPKSGDRLILSSTRRPVERKKDLPILLYSLGRLWMAGEKVDWQEFSRQEPRCKVPLPTYPFEHSSYWIHDVKQVGDDNEGRPFHQPLESPVVNTGREKTSEICAPQNDMELQIANIFCDLIGVHQVSILDSFFDIGGDSLLSLQLLERIRESCDVNLSLVDIFEQPTVKGLAKLIESGGGHLRNITLRLNNGSDKNLIYFVVGIHLYTELAQHLSSIAQCYGMFISTEEALFDVGADNKKWTVSDLAAAYCEEIHKHSQGRPVTLVGVSFGGVVAYEIARQLRQRGQTITLLVMLDSLLPSGRRRNYIKWGQAQLKKILKDGIGSVAPKLWGAAMTLLSKCKLVYPKSFSPRECLVNQRGGAYADAVERFEMVKEERIYPDSTLLISAKDEPRYPGYEIDSHFGWRKYISGEFYVAMAPGDHLGILKSPNVQITAGIIKRILQEKV